MHGWIKTYFRIRNIESCRHFLFLYNQVDFIDEQSVVGDDIVIMLYLTVSSFWQKSQSNNVQFKNINKALKCSYWLRADQSRAEQNSAEQSRAEHCSAEQNSAEQSSAEQSSPKQSQAEPSRAEQSRAE